MFSKVLVGSECVILSMQHNAGMGLGSCDFILNTSRGLERAEAASSHTHVLPHSSASTLGVLAMLAKYSDADADVGNTWKPTLAMQNLDAILSGLAQNNDGWVVPFQGGHSWVCNWPAADGAPAFSLKALCMHVGVLLLL